MEHANDNDFIFHGSVVDGVLAMEGGAQACRKHLTFCADQRCMQQDPAGDFECAKELACSGLRRLLADVSPDLGQIGFGLIGEAQAQRCGAGSAPGQ